MIFTALLIGLAGSLHCVGMCSPLAMAVSGLSQKTILTRMYYNAGRILTYGVMGAVVGALGAVAGLTSYQHLLSAGLGLLLVLMGVSGVSFIRIPVLTPAMQHAAGWLKLKFGQLVQSRGRKAFVLMGVVNGLLPCGLTYFALAYCVSLPNASQGFAFMLLFGVGTLPAMIGIPTFVAFVSTKLNRSFRQTTAVIMILLGSLLMIRSAWVHPHEPVRPEANASEVICP